MQKVRKTVQSIAGDFSMKPDDGHTKPCRCGVDESNVGPTQGIMLDGLFNWGDNLL